MKLPQLLTVGCILASCLFFPGCGINPGTTTVPYPNISGNWQIQTGPSTPAVSGIILLGALSNHGSAVSGTFRFTNLAQPQACGGFNQVIPFTGTVDSGGTIVLASASFASGSTVKIKLTPAVSGTYNGTIEVDGTTCSAASAPAIALQFPSLTGTSTGNFEPGTLANPGATGGGPASLTLTQATTPAADGQFPVTGQLTFTLASCVSTVSLTGTVSGPELNLSTPANGINVITELTAVSIPASNQLLTEIFYPASPCAASSTLPTIYSGTLTHP